MQPTKTRAFGTLVIWPLLAAGPALAGDGVVVMDQIGSNGDSWMAGSATSSQHPPDNPQGAFSTIDNFSVTGDALRLTQIEGVTAALQNFTSYDLVLSWTVNIYSSLEAAETDFFGDVFTQTFDTPDSMTDGFSFVFDGPSELISFGIDAVVDPGDYWVGITMENDSALNGTVGIRGSFVGDGGAWFAVPDQNSSFQVGNPAAYRVTGTAVPSPGAFLVLGLGGLLTRRRRPA